jgi:hypothetical protein
MASRGVAHSAVAVAVAVMQLQIRTRKLSILVGPLSSAMLMHWLETVMMLTVSVILLVNWLKLRTLLTVTDRLFKNVISHFAMCELAILYTLECTYIVHIGERERDYNALASQQV